MDKTFHDFFYTKDFGKGAGLKGAIDLNTAKLIIKYFNSDIKKEIGHIKVKDQNISIQAGVSCKLSNIHFGVVNYSHEKVKISFEPSNLIHIYINDLEAWGHITSCFKVLLVPYTENTSFEINKLIVNATVMIKSKLVGDKLLPDAEVIALDYKYDFDFALTSKFGKFVILFKNAIKKLIRDEINKLIDKKLNLGIQIGLSMIPLEIVVDKNKGYVIDYSLICTPFIENNFILFNSYARFINKYLPETQNKENYFLPFNIPSYDLIGKSSQLYVSEYVINTALFTFFKTRELEILITPDMLPANLPLIKLNTSWLNMIFKDLSSVFGMDIPIYFRVLVSENPQLILKDEMISFILPSNIEVIVEGFEGVAVKFKTTFFVDVVLKVFEDCKISGNIKSLNIQNTKIISSYQDDEEFGSKVEKQFNVLKGLALPFINMFVLKNMHFDLPVIKGIKFTDLTISHHENFVIINYNFQYNELERI